MLVKVMEVLALFWALCFANVLVRYLVATGVVALGIRAVPQRRIQRLEVSPEQTRREQVWTLSTIVIFATFATPMLFAIRKGWTLTYRGIDSYAYLIASFVLAVVIHDTYFYWTHRLLHLPAFRKFHEVHHKSRTPTVWTVLAFHPVEAFIQVGIYPILLFALPMHSITQSAFLFYAAVFGALTHCGHDVLSAVRRHDLHHLTGQGNYSFCFPVWDRLMRTGLRVS